MDRISRSPYDQELDLYTGHYMDSAAKKVQSNFSELKTIGAELQSLSEVAERQASSASIFAEELLELKEEITRIKQIRVDLAAAKKMLISCNRIEASVRKKVKPPLLTNPLPISSFSRPASAISISGSINPDVTPDSDATEHLSLRAGRNLEALDIGSSRIQLDATDTPSDQINLTTRPVTLPSFLRRIPFVPSHSANAEHKRSLILGVIGALSLLLLLFGQVPLISMVVSFALGYLAACLCPSPFKPMVL